MIPLSKITGEKNSNRQTKYNRRIPLSQIIGTTSPQEELEKDNGLFDTAGNAFDWWKNNSLAGAGFLGGLASETAGNILQNLGLESAGNLAQNAADEMLDFGAKKVYTADADNFSGSFANQLMSGLTGSFGRLASMIHSDKTADAMIKSSDSLANKTPVSTDNLAEYFTNPRGFISDAGQLAGSMAAIVPFMGLAPEAAVARGVATFGGDAITQALINRGLYNAAKVFAGGAPRAAQYALTSAPVEGAMEGGETRRELLNQGKSEEEATKESLITMGKNIPLLLATNALEGLAFFSPLKGANKALQIAGRAAANSAQEQYEEFAQEGIQNAARGEPYSWLPWNGAPNQYEAAERVRYPALLMGGVGGTAQALGGRNENQENFERGSQENISVEDYSARANLTAKQAEIWDAAQYASARAKEKFGYDISPELIYKQWAHEAGVNFDSENARYNNNFGGLTQTEPNGEENKQPDGNNYYRHFNNVREYANAYVDDFIKYYPEISGAKNEREFASVLKSYGYFGDDLENYVAGMEGIQTPANRTSGNQPKIDFASGLQSARKSLDGKQMDNGTVGCVEAVTKILSHVHPEFKKMVDDGVVNTVEGENSLKSRLEKMGVEIVPFDESNVAQGDIIFYDGEQTYQHVLVADHMDEQGNWRVFGNSSSANKVMEQPLYQGQTPAWIAKVSNLNGTTNAQTQSQGKTSQTEQEESKPLFDINTEDSTTQKLLEQFAKERFSKAVDDEDAEPVNFFNGMFDDKDKFQNTPENRNAIITRYGDEFKTWAANQNQQEQPQKQTQSKKQTQPQKENSFDNGFSLKQAVDQLKAKATQERNASLLLQLNRAENNPAELKNILEQNGVKISQPQPQQDPVTQNTTPENVLPKKSSLTERKIKVASAPVKTGNKGLKSRKKQGAALIDLATQNGIEIPNPEVIALTKGSTKAVQKWRDNLMQAGTFKISAPQTQENSPTLKERAQKILEQNVVNETSTKADKVRAAQADEQARQAQERARQESATQSLQTGELAQQELAQTTAQNLQNRQRPESKPVPKTQSVQTAQAEAQALQAQEEYRRRQAEQARQANEQAIQSFGQTQSQSVQKQKQNYGRATTAVTDSKTKYPVRYKIVEADELNTSHKIEGLGVVPNDDYRGIQPRDRERVGMQYDLLETAKNFDPDLALDQALSVNSGAPIVRNDNVVLNGNGRTIANRYAYENGNGDAYKNALIQNAQNFGLDANEISKMNRPILVREVVGDLGEKEMRDIAGATAGGSGMSSSEQANSDAKKISSETIANFAQDEIDFNARELSEATKNLATSVLQNVATPAELNGYSDANGQIGQAGITRAKNAIAAYAYGKNDVLNRMSESTDDNIRNITAALANAAPDVAKVRAGMQNNSLHNYDLNFIADAAEKLSNLRNDEKKTASDYLNETTLGDTGLSTEAREVLSFLDKNKHSSQKISDFIKGIAKNIREQGDPQQGSLFGESEPAPLIDLIKRVRQEVENQEVESQEEKPAPKTESAQEEKKSKRKSKGKWHTIGSANSREDLQKYMQSHGMTVQITPDEKIITSDGKTLSDKIRVVKGRWQYGYYETDAKHSAQGEVDTRIENFVDEKDLTPQQKLLKSFGEKLGTKVVFFRNEDGDFHGAHASGKTYINVNSKMPLGKVFWHESMHWLKKNNAKLYDELVKAADITDEQRDAYLERSGRTDLYTDAAIDEEIIADQFEDVAKRTGLLQNIAGKNRGLIERVVQWLKDTMNKFIAHFRNPQGKFTTEQATRLADEFGKIAKDLVDPNGQKIFRYNRRTHNIELADGRNLDSVKSNDDTRYSFAGRKAKTADKESLKRAKQMEKRGANRDEIYNATGWFKGKDNKWRFEIPDNFDKIDFDKLLKNNENFFSLDKIYDNPALFAAYPKLRKVLVRSKQLKSPELYGYTNGTEITLNRSKINDEREAAGETLVHEIQHVIQDYEIFSSGGSDSNVLSEMLRNLKLIRKEVAKIPNGKKSLKPLSEAFSAARFAREMGEDEAELLQDAEDTIRIIEKGFSPTNWKKIKYLAERYSELSDTVDNIRDAKGEYDDETGEPLKNIYKRDAYERLGGEQEARAVGERLFNRNGTPKSHDEDALIIFGGQTYGMIRQSRNKKTSIRNGDGELVKDGAMREIFPPSAATANGTTDYWSPASLKVTHDNKGGVGTSGNSVDTNSPNGSISQGEDEIKYSLGNSDNSSESLKQKIKNKLSAYFDDRPSARRDKRIKDTLQKITGYRILFSHTNSDETIVDDFNKLIQAKHAYEWEKLLPQIGGKIAQRLKLNPNSEQSNYIADWLLTGALNNTSAEAKNFQKAMRENPEVAQLLQDVRNTFQEISDMSALERYKSKIVHKEKKPLIQRLWGERKNIIEQWFDDLHPIKRMVQKMKETASPEVAKMIDEMNPYKMARLVRGKGALAELMIETDKENIEAVRNAFREQYPFMKFDRLKSLAMIIEEAGGKQNLEDFEAFCVAKLDKEIYEKNRANPDGKQITPMDTEENADAAIKAGEKKFGTAQRDLVTYSNILLTMQFNAGLISQKQYSGIIKGWKNYVPMARVFDENEDFDFSNSLERKVGSKRDTFSPIAKLTCNTQEFIAQAERNKVKLELANIVHCGGFGEILADVENRNPDVKDIITYKENGQKKYLQVADITIKRAIDSMQTKSESTWLMKTLHSTSRFMRACLTLANPDYAIGNIFRDMVDAFIHNKNLDANPFVAAMEVWRAGFREVVGKKKSQDYIDWLANGGSQSGFITEDIDTAERSINKITGNTSRFRKVLDGFYQLAEVSEYATRLNTYKTSKAKLAAKRADGKATIEDKRNAALMSRDASIDFAKAGRSGRQLNRLLLFSNAALQSLSLWGQKLSPAKLKTKEGRKEAASAVFRAVAMGIIPAILQAVLRNSDDDWKKKYKQAQDWEKDTYWIFGDVKVPKGVDLSIRLMSAFTDEVLDKMIDDDPVEFDRIKKAFIDAAPSLTATIFTPTIEAMANYSFFREAPIVPYSEQHLPKHLQYGSNTSTVAKLTGEIFGASPRKIDYLINGYFGFMGRTGSRIPDFLQRGMTLDEVPMLRRFYFNPYKNPKVVKDFYEAYDEQEELLKGYKLERQKGEKVSLPEEYDAALHKRLKAAQETMRKLSKAQKAILDNPKLSFSERQEKIQALEKRRIALCEKVFKRAQ